VNETTPVWVVKAIRGKSSGVSLCQDSQEIGKEARTTLLRLCPPPPPPNLTFHPGFPREGEAVSKGAGVFICSPGIRDKTGGQQCLRGI